MVLAACGTAPSSTRSSAGGHRGGGLRLPAAAEPARRHDRAAGRNFAAAALITAIASTDADVLVRVKNGRKLPVLRRYPDGSCLSLLGATQVRVIDCEITISTSAGRRTGIYRLATTLLDPGRYPAPDLIRLYHERWEIETAYLERSPRSSADGSCGPAPRPGSTRRSTPSWSPTRSCAPPWRTPPPAGPAPARTGPASASPCTPPATSSSRPPASSPEPPSTWPEPSAACPGQPAARPQTASQPPRRQTSYLQIPGPRPQPRPDHLQRHHQHRYPGTTRDLDSHPQHLTTRPWG